jgi:predicted pyridoxine 5'-phosphate oxidase superfamily flavin-nucleotide-binding protein
MTQLPESVLNAWTEREGPVVLVTVDTAGVPNAIYVTCVQKLDNETIVIADNYFNKTRTNILTGSSGALLFITKTGKSFQLKGRIEYHSDGPVFDAMKSWNPSKHPGVAATALKVAQVYSGGEQLA